jgi:putative ABC transport system ATP-binding protein
LRNAKKNSGFAFASGSDYKMNVQLPFECSEAADVGASERASARLDVRSLSSTLGGKPILRDVSFRLHAQEILAVTGPSGAGKSSLLRLLNRLDDPSAGEVLVDGIDHRRLKPQDLRRRVGMVMQRAYLFSGTVEENIRFGPRQIGVSVPDSEVQSMLERIGLRGFAHRDVGDLSGGEAQRVSFARMLMNKPSIVLLDEPTSALDEASARSIEELLVEVVGERRLGCLIVTHDKRQASRIAERTMTLEAGRMITIGLTREVLHGA